MKNQLVIKSNDLVQARYELSLNEQKIILYSITKLDSNKLDMNILNINIGDFIKLLGTTKDRYKEIRSLTNGLRKKELVMNTGNGEIITSWLVSIEYIKNKGVIELEFSKKLIPYLLQLKKNFTRYQIENILYLSNKHSIRIYELLKQYETIGKRTFTVDELKSILMLENQYNRFYDFERYVLKPTMEEINEYTDIHIEYEKITQGKIIKSLKYIIEPKKACKYKDYLEETYNIREIKENTGLQDENFNSEQIIKLYEVACYKMGNDYQSEADIFNYININYKSIQGNENIINRFSYLKDILEHDRAKAIVYIRANKEASNKNSKNIEF